MARAVASLYDSDLGEQVVGKVQGPTGRTRRARRSSLGPSWSRFSSTWGRFVQSFACGRLRSPHGTLQGCVAYITFLFQRSTVAEATRATRAAASLRRRLRVADSQRRRATASCRGHVTMLEGTFGLCSLSRTVRMLGCAACGSLTAGLCPRRQAGLSIQSCYRCCRRPATSSC